MVSRKFSIIHLFVLLLIPTVFLLSTPQPACAEKSDLESLLPSSMLKKDFKTPYEYSVYDDTSLFEYMDGGAPFYIERGFEELISSEYKRGEDSFIVDIYKIENAESAAGLFKDIKKKGQEKTPFGQDGQMRSNQAEFFRGRYFVRIVAFKTDAKTLSTVKEFAEAIDLKIKNETKGEKK